MLLIKLTDYWIYSLTLCETPESTTVPIVELIRIPPTSVRAARSTRFTQVNGVSTLCVIMSF